MKHIISLGAGVQSSTMALMAALGEITPMPDAAIFADTQAEPQSVYKWLDWLEAALPFPVYRITKGNLRDAALETRVSAKGNKYFKTKIPWHTINADGSPGFINMRNCTADFKVRPIRKKVKELAGIKRGEKEVRVIQWIGISIDEAHRMRDSRDVWQVNRYPLIDQRISRTDCLNWMLAHGFPRPPRSACIFCGFHSPAEWKRLKIEEPEAFLDACKFEQEAQEAQESQESQKILLAKVFLSKYRMPLTEVNFGEDQLEMFGNECEGMCGV